MTDEVPTPWHVPDVVDSLEREIVHIDELAGADGPRGAEDLSPSEPGAEEPPD
jgi:hypothetical protein